MPALNRHFPILAAIGGPEVIERPPVIKPEAAKPPVQPPQRYVVMIHNDDTTPHEFVMEVLQVKFNKGPHDAFNIMSEAEDNGKAPVVTLPRELAETKADQANAFARQRQHPTGEGQMQLTFTAEPL
jgi:ATP-dependent Clp protease adaptor protein ClpS